MKLSNPDLMESIVDSDFKMRLKLIRKEVGMTMKEWSFNEMDANLNGHQVDAELMKTVLELERMLWNLKQKMAAKPDNESLKTNFDFLMKVYRCQWIAYNHSARWGAMVEHLHYVQATATAFEDLYKRTHDELGKFIAASNAYATADDSEIMKDLMAKYPKLFKHNGNMEG
jgi:hypothetical protein